MLSRRPLADARGSEALLRSQALFRAVTRGSGCFTIAVASLFKQPLPLVTAQNVARYWPRRKALLNRDREGAGF
jgi:hypothetical protein